MRFDVKRGDVFFVDLGINGVDVKGSEQDGERPCIVVGNDYGNKYSPVIQVVPTTTKQKKPMPTHVNVKLLKDSTVLCEHIRSIDVGRIREKIGIKISNEKMKEIDSALRAVFWWE